MTDKHACSATVFGPRVHNWPCNRAGAVKRKGKWYCRQHDPEARKARDREAAEQRAEKRRADDAISAQAEVLAKALGVDGAADYHSFGPFSTHGPVKRLVMSFKDAERLIARLKGDTQ